MGSYKAAGHKQGYHLQNATLLMAVLALNNVLNMLRVSEEAHIIEINQYKNIVFIEYID